MKRALPVLLLILLILTGCGGTAATPPSSSTPPSSTVQEPSNPTPPDTDPPADTPEEPVPGWQAAYLTVLEELCGDYGKYIVPADSDLLSGVKYARLLDFNGDGVRELVVLFDRSVRLYTCQDAQAVLLFEGTVGGRFGQADVSYTFHVNAVAQTPCLVLFHTENEWCEEALTIVHLTGTGEVIQTELFAATDGQNEAPDRASLVEFQINGQTVLPEVYESARSAALDDSTEIDVDWGAFPATQAQLDLVFRALAAWDDEHSCYILPGSDAAYLTEADLTRLTARELRLARNEIYARHGRAFDAPDLKAYFTDQNWYHALYTPATFDPLSTELLNKYEIANLSLILAVEGSGNYNQNAPDLTPEEALSIAEAYWDYWDGKLDSETGYLMAISTDERVEAGGRSYYTFRLRGLVEGDHWSTREVIYVDAQTGATTTTLSE